MSTTATTAPAKTALPNEGRPGYTHTKLGWIPEEWEVKPLSKVVRPDRKVRYGIVQAGEHLPDGIPCLRVVDLALDSVDIDSLYRTSQKISDQYKDCILQVGDIVFALRGEIGKLLLVDDRIAGINITRGVARISPRATVQPEYLFYQLQAYGVSRRIDLEVNGTSLKEVPIGGLNRVEIAYPKNPMEQRRIAAVLGAWDRAIATAQELLAAQQARKRGLMQELLTGKRRFPGFGGKWKEVRLGDAFEFLRTTSHSRADLTNEPEQGSVAYIHYGDIHATYTTPVLDLKKNKQVPLLRDSITLNDNMDYLRNGDLVIADASEDYDGVGASIELSNIGNQRVIAGLHTMALRDRSGCTVPGFRAYMLREPIVANRMRTLATGSKVYGISKTNLASLMLLLPSPEEQQRIIGTLHALDHVIEHRETQLEHLTTQKRGLMQQLLTGAVRVKH